MRVLGIDPGYDRCGFAILGCEGRGRGMQLLGSGTFRTSRGEPLAQRLHSLGRQLEQAVADWQPQELAIEQLYFNKNAKTAIEVSQARGVVLERCAASGLSVAEYTPTQVKSQLTGNGAAAKAQVAFMVCKLTGLKQEAQLDDELDAIAVALCHGMRMSIPNIISNPVAAAPSRRRGGAPAPPAGQPSGWPDADAAARAAAREPQGGSPTESPT